MNNDNIQTVEVWEQFHNGNNWETISGAAWDMVMRDGESFRDACIRHGGDFSNESEFRLVAYNEDGDEEFAEVFAPGEL
ncbi:MAG: hypothetical protein AAF916_04200 [Planctomycetota bacterium]